MRRFPLHRRCRARSDDHVRPLGNRLAKERRHHGRIAIGITHGEFHVAALNIAQSAQPADKGVIKRFGARSVAGENRGYARHLARRLRERRPRHCERSAYGAHERPA